MYDASVVDASDAQVRIGVGAAAVVLFGALTALRFCGDVGPLPPKPPPPRPAGPARDLVARGAASPAVYQEFLEKDAALANARVPSREEMGRQFPYRVDEARHVLEIGAPPIDLAGLRLDVTLDAGALVLRFENLTGSDLAYHLETSPTPNISGCTQAPARPFNAMVIGKGGRSARVECAFREGMALAVTTVETLEVPPLSAYYLTQLPPQLVGVEDRIARGHQRLASGEPCSAVVSQVVRNAIDRGVLGWRDLVDFYARHRCATYRFPPEYRAFRANNERELPVTAAGN